MAMAITVKLALVLGFLQGGASRWRAQLHACARDLDLGVMNAQDARRLEVIADGLPLLGGAQLAVDTTIVSALHCDGTFHQRAASADRVRCVAARRRKERIYPERIAPRSRCRVDVLANEVGGQPGPRPGASHFSCK